jgi:hypothetical protein
VIRGNVSIVGQGGVTFFQVRFTLYALLIITFSIIVQIS